MKRGAVRVACRRIRKLMSGLQKQTGCSGNDVAIVIDSRAADERLKLQPSSDLRELSRASQLTDCNRSAKRSREARLLRRNEAMQRSATSRLALEHCLCNATEHSSRHRQDTRG